VLDLDEQAAADGAAGGELVQRPSTFGPRRPQAVADLGGDTLLTDDHR
jgi:hypothetical protein